MTKTFFLVGPNVHHIEELQRAKEELTKAGKLQVFGINSAEEYQDAIKKIQSHSQENPADKIRIVTDAHGVEREGEGGKSHGTGQLGFGRKEVYPAEIATDLKGCNIEFIDNSACCIGTGIASKGNENLERYQNIPPNVPIILNGGRLKAITTLLQPEIVKTLSLGEDSSALENFLNKPFHPNTLKVVMRKEGGELVTHKISAPKPTSLEDVTSEAVARHIGREIDRSVDWWRDNVDSSINSEGLKKSCAERITPELVEQYRGQALIMETHRKKADYVRCYIEAGTNPNHKTADGSTILHLCKDVDLMKELLTSPLADVNAQDCNGISVLCVASYGKNSKEISDLIINHPNCIETLESFNASREAFKSNILKGEDQLQYHNMNDPLVNYVRAELCFREGRAEEAKKYIGVAIEGEVADPSRKQQYQDHFQSYKSMEALDLAIPKETVGNKSEKSWVEKIEDRKLSVLKGGVREI